MQKYEKSNPLTGLKRPGTLQERTSPQNPLSTMCFTSPWAARGCAGYPTAAASGITKKMLQAKMAGRCLTRCMTSLV